MEKNYNLSLLVPFSTPVGTINGIKFSSREIDILACILGGRTTKKIASFLTLSPKTIENYIRNITLKLECNAREGIIDFVEQSDKFFFIKNHYSNLILQAGFEKSLENISKLNIKKNVSCSLMCWEKADIDKPFIHSLQKHLKLVGFVVSVEPQQKSELFTQSLISFSEVGYMICIVPQSIVEEKSFIQLFQKKARSSQNVLFLLPEADNSKEIKNLSSLNFVVEKNYYFLVFEILEKLLLDLNLEKIISSFKEKYENIQKGTHHISSLEEQKVERIAQETKKPAVLKIVVEKKWYLLSAITFMIFLSLSFLVMDGFQDQKGLNRKDYINTSHSIRSDLILPAKAIIVDRPELTAKIEEKLKGQEDIQTVALVGIGGAGKTTLARDYARSQPFPLIWEINSETHESLISSFDDLAHTLAKTEEEKKNLRNLQDIKNSEKRENKLLLFIKEHLREHSKWLLIYDNVEKFADLQNYFPQDGGPWGQGKIILTTRNSNFQNNKYVNGIIFIDELNDQKKLELFIKIMHNNNTNSVTPAQYEESREFLEAIPPFPLDVSVAAYYLKATHIPYKNYLENLAKYDKEFLNVQENVLKDSGEYIKTRYHIITLSLQQFINLHKDFADLLLFISFLDSQSIPRELLSRYKDEAVVDNFIYNLKKYSLVTNEANCLSLGSTFSIHRSTQEVSLVYLIKALNLKDDKQQLQSIAHIFEQYIYEAIEKKKYSDAELLVNHCKVFLKHNNLPENVRGTIENALGRIYCYLRDYKKAKETYEDGLAHLKQDKDKNNIQIFQSLSSLGDVYRELGDYKKAKDLLEENLITYKKNLPQNHSSIAQGLLHLGNIYREVGKYEKGKELLEEALKIYETYHPGKPVETAWTLLHLGTVSRELGGYRKAKDLLEKSLNSYQKHFSKNHIYVAGALIFLGKVYTALGQYEKAKSLFEESMAIQKSCQPDNQIYPAWISQNLGEIYNELGDYKKAQNLLEHSFKLYKDNLPDNDVYLTLVLINLGNAYTNLGQYAKAKSLLEQSLRTYENHYGKEHIETARVLKNLGKVYLLEGHMKEAENLFMRALNIFQKSNHPDIYMVFEGYAQFYLKRSKDEENEGNFNQSQAFKTKAMDYLKQALEVAKANFPEESPHIVRIKSKLENINEK